MSDDRILGILSHKAAEMAEPDVNIPDEQYRKVRDRLITFFRLHRRPDPESHADEVICRAVRRIREGATIDTSLAAFCLGVARNVLREGFKEKTSQELSIEPPDERGGRFLGLNPVEQGLLVNECLEVLPCDDRKLFLDYHMEDRLTLARRRGQSANALRIQVHRICKSILESVGASRGPGIGRRGITDTKRRGKKAHL